MQQECETNMVGPNLAVSSMSLGVADVWRLLTSIAAADGDCSSGNRVWRWLSK